MSFYIIFCPSFDIETLCIITVCARIGRKLSPIDMVDWGCKNIALFIVFLKALMLGIYKYKYIIMYTLNQIYSKWIDSLPRDTLKRNIFKNWFKMRRERQIRRYLYYSVCQKRSWPGLFMFSKTNKWYPRVQWSIIFNKHSSLLLIKKMKQIDQS